jgi:GTP-binding protein
MNNDYINNSEELVNLFVLIDSRHALQDMDLAFMQSLGKAHIPFAVIFTKADKMGKEAMRKSVENIKKEMLEYWEELPPCFVSSAEKGTGKEDILSYIEKILNSIKNK